MILPSDQLRYIVKHRLYESKTKCHETILAFSYDHQQPELERMTPYELRLHILSSLDDNAAINFAHIGIDRDVWRQRMSREFTYCDNIFISHTSWVLGRAIRLVPFYREEAWDASGTMFITADNGNRPTIYMLYFSDLRFYNPHFQSIRPLPK